MKSRRLAFIVPAVLLLCVGGESILPAGLPRNMLAPASSFWNSSAPVPRPDPTASKGIDPYDEAKAEAAETKLALIDLTQYAVAFAGGTWIFIKFGPSFSSWWDSIWTTGSTTSKVLVIYSGLVGLLSIGTTFFLETDQRASPLLYALIFAAIFILFWVGTPITLISFAIGGSIWAIACLVEKVRQRQRGGRIFGLLGSASEQIAQLLNSKELNTWFVDHIADISFYSHREDYNKAMRHAKKQEWVEAHAAIRRASEKFNRELLDRLNAMAGDATQKARGDKSPLAILSGFKDKLSQELRDGLNLAVYLQLLKGKIELQLGRKKEARRSIALARYYVKQFNLPASTPHLDKIGADLKNIRHQIKIEIAKPVPCDISL